MKFEIILNEHTPEITEQITDVPAFITENKEMLQAFVEFAAAQPTGVGLAANQVMLDGKRLMHRFFAAKNIKYGNWDMFFMPKITLIGMVETKIEGCLTYPGKDIIAKRSRACTVEYHNWQGYLTETFKGFTAQIMQHECNHLNGFKETIVDRPYNSPLNNPNPTRSFRCSKTTCPRSYYRNGKCANACCKSINKQVMQKTITYIVQYSPVNENNWVTAQNGPNDFSMQSLAEIYKQKLILKDKMCRFKVRIVEKTTVVTFKVL